MKKRNKRDALYLRNLQRKVRLDAKSLYRKLKAALEVSGLSFREVGVIIVSDRRIAEYNRRYLGLNRATDVLSFKTGNREGEVLVSAEAAEAQAKEYRQTLEEELLTLSLHGLLHLAGYDDHKAEDRRKMFAETGRILKKAYDGKERRKAP